MTGLAFDGSAVCPARQRFVTWPARKIGDGDAAAQIFEVDDGVLKLFHMYGITKRIYAIVRADARCGSPFPCPPAISMLACCPHRDVETDQHSFVGNHFVSSLQGVAPDWPGLRE